MQAPNVSTPTAERISTIFVAIELSQKTWLITMHSPEKDRISRHKLAGGDHVGLLALVDRERERGTRAVGKGDAGSGNGPGGGELLRGRLRRVLAAPASDGGGDHEPRVRPCKHCG